jgi:3-isopropylmalate dehydrogenase
MKIVLLPGDGIGPEVVDAAVLVMDAVAARFGGPLRFDSRPMGGVALRQGLPPLPEATLQACLASDAVLLGAVGDPEFDRAPRDGKPETGLLAIRKAMGVYANLRPARVWPGLEDAGPLRPDRVAGTDMLIVRELTGGLYFGEPRGIDPDGASAVNTLRYSTSEIERIAVVAFEAARARRRRLTSVDKSNVLETSQLWRATVERVAGRYPDVALDHLLVDACAMMLALDPTRFDVIVTENLFGDILSDEAGAVAGSLGLLPSASLGEGPGLYEPVHGSAPALAGKDAANPIGAIASAAMLFRHSLGREAEAEAIEGAIGAVIREGPRTADIARPGETPAPCSAVARAIAERVRKGQG